MLKPRGLLCAGTGALLGAAFLAGCPWLGGPGGGPSPSPAPSGGPQAIDLQKARTDILSALSTSTYASLFSGQLINDGIGIFSLSTSWANTGLERWGREYAPVSGPPAATVSVKVGVPNLATVEFSNRESGVWLGDFPWRTRLVTKTISDTFEREALLVQGTDGHWALTGLSPGRQRPASATVNIEDVTLASSASFTTYTSGILAAPLLPSFLPGQTLVVTVDATGASASAFIYGAAGNRLPLAFAGAHGAGLRFTGLVTMPSGAAGPVDLGLDVLAPSTLASPAGAYDATLWGIPVLRSGGAS